MNTHTHFLPNLSRREMLQGVSSGFGYLALAGMCAEAAPVNPLAPKTTHFAPRAKRVIFLCMGGGPSHLDTFDYKPSSKPTPARRSSRATSTRAPVENYCVHRGNLPSMARTAFGSPSSSRI